MTARRAVLNTLLKVTEEGAYANLAVKECLSDVQPNNIGRSTALVYTTIEKLAFCDHIIANYAKGRLNTQIRGILRLAVAELFFMDTPAHAVCNESVKLTCEIGKSGLKGYVNAVLRSIARDKQSGNLPELPSDTAQRLAVTTGYPEFIIREHIGRFGESFTEELLNAQQVRPNIRAVYPTEPGAVEEHLRSLGIGFERGILPDSFSVSSLKGLTDDVFFSSGKMTVQSLGAMLACRCLDPKPGMNVLDSCAAPGGKTAYIFDLMQRKGCVTAWDIHPHRVELIRKMLERLNISDGVSACVKDASVFYQEFKGSFDVVLCDVPCSGLGGGSKPDARYRKTEEIVNELSELQYAILSACSGYLHSGGRLVYSTCTVSLKENEGVAERFLSEHPEFAPADIAEYLPEQLRDRVEKGMITLLPNRDGTEGFFIAGFDKK